MTPKEILSEWIRFCDVDCNGNVSRAVSEWHGRLSELGVTKDENTFAKEAVLQSMGIKHYNRKRFLRPI